MISEVSTPGFPEADYLAAGSVNYKHGWIWHNLITPNHGAFSYARTP